MTAQDAISYNAETRQILCQGNWDIAHLSSLKNLLSTIKIPSGKISINGEAVKSMDTAGAWLLNTWKNAAEKKGAQATFEGFTEQHETLLSLVENRVEHEDIDTIPVEPKPSWIEHIGRASVVKLQNFTDYLEFVGRLSVESLRIVKNPSHLRLSSIAGVIYRTGYQALPIIALLSFMIGVVITYQMGLQLRNYGANVFIVDLLGLAILREFGPLLTAIMVAGRTGSAFTAQIGMMKLNQEIDALDTMGVTPGELLLLPRIIGLVIALPLLTMWADMFGVFGGMVMSNNMLSITWYDFLHRFPTVIPLRALLIGLGKTPIFALIIASVGCHQGMRVAGSADSVGQNTTKSVVLSIFFIIVADAIFSIIFSKLKL